MSRADEAAKRILPPVALDALRAVRGRRDAAAWERERVPWSRGYNAAKMAACFAASEDERLLASLERGGPLPPGHGRGFDERVVEYPWTYARTPPGPGRFLDAGSVFNNPRLLAHPRLSGKKVHLLTLGPEEGCYWTTGASYLYEDLRDLPYKDALFDTVACVSTLEHVGFDNFAYTGREEDREDRPDDFLKVMGEFRRVLRPGGQLLLTVPFGAYVRYDRGQQYDLALLERCIRAFGDAKVEREFFRYEATGWRRATAEECADVRGVAWRANRADTGPFPVQPDGAVAARAVAAVRFVR